MSALEWLIAGVGAAVTVVVVVAMILIAPRNALPVPDEAAEEQTELSPLPAVAD